MSVPPVHPSSPPPILPSSHLSPTAIPTHHSVHASPLCTSPPHSLCQSYVCSPSIPPLLLSFLHLSATQSARRFSADLPPPVQRHSVTNDMFSCCVSVIVDLFSSQKERFRSLDSTEDEDEDNYDEEVSLVFVVCIPRQYFF